MSRQAPRHLPTTLPNGCEAAAIIEKYVVRAPRMRMGDMSIRQLVEKHAEGPVWLTGSNVWLPAVFGDRPPPDTDFDLIFQRQVDCDRFVQAVLAELNARIPGFEFVPGKSTLGAQKILFPEPQKPLVEAAVNSYSGHPYRWNSCKINMKKCYAALNKERGILDAWALADGQTVGEVLMSYTHDYQRVAYSMHPAIAGHEAALTRIVRAAPQKMSSRY